MTTLVSYGGGTDSTAALILLLKEGMPPPHAILFADTGGEKPHTYDYIQRFSRGLQACGYPPITVLRRSRRDKTWKSLEDDCLERGWLPSIAYGWKTCSQKYKVEPQEKWANNDPSCKAVWARGDKVIKIIGYNFDETKRARFGEDDKYRWSYPLIERAIGRDKAEQIIVDTGLPLPGKSACFFCPHAKKPEILDLAQRYPELAQRALNIETAAKRNTKKVKGLGRTFAWRDVLANHELTPAEDPFDEIPCGCYDG